MPYTYNGKLQAVSNILAIYLLNLPQITRVAILPFADTMERISGDIFKDILAPYLSSDAIKGFAVLGRPACCGDVFTVAIADSRKSVQFEVCAMESSCGEVESGIIGPDTIIHCQGRPIKRTERPYTRRYQRPSVDLSLEEYSVIEAEDFL